MERQSFIGELRELGVKSGMTLMVHSSLKSIGANSLDSGAETVIDALLDVLGPDGTLISPTISGCVQRNQPVFHVEYTPSTVGFFTEAMRMRPDAVRSLHPVHSVSAIGPKAAYFTEGHHKANTPWSPETPYGRLLRDPDCSILFLGVNLNCNSCFHALEIESRIPGMHSKDATVLHVIESDGNVHQVEHHWHHPRTERRFPDMEPVLYDSGCLRWGKTGRGISRLVKAEPMRRVILDLLSSEPWLMIRPPADSDFIWEP